jgi:tetratricopeptide (TPR) repeat protein
MNYFNLSVEKSTRNGFDKALTLITLGDLYYQKQKYIKAQPCYDEASKIITVDNPDYARVAKRAETLAELVVQHEIVVLQDSLQVLSKLPDDKKLAVVNKIIEKLIADEKAAAEAEKQKEEMANQFEDIESMAPLGVPMGTAGDWYFYNVNLMKTGQSEFQKKWGRRKLEDNWRRMNKSASLFAEDENKTVNQQDVTENTSDTSNVNKEVQVTDNKTPAFYLQQIPVTQAQIAKSNSEIATALFNMGMIYKEKVEDFPMAIKTFDEFARRFPSDERREESYFQSYMLETKSENMAKADVLMGWIKKYRPATYNLLEEIDQLIKKDPKDPKIAQTYEKIDKEQLADSIAEQPDCPTLVIPVNLGWDDVGNWGAIFDLISKSKNVDIVTKGNVVDHDSKNCLVYADKKPIAILGLEDIVIVDSPDALLVTTREKAQYIKDLLPKLDEKLL